MPRQARKKSESNIYHVIIKGVDNQRLFLENSDYSKYLNILKINREQCNFELFAYCLMSNHVHLLLRTSSTPLDKIFRKINTTYSCWFNIKYSRTGPLQEDRYFSEPVDDISYLISVVRYIHRNPVKAKLEAAIGESYKWSSYNAYLGYNNGLVDTGFVLRQYGTLDYFVSFHHSKDDEICRDIENIRSRLSDNAAADLIIGEYDITKTTDLCDFQENERNNAIIDLYHKGISIRQMNRLTGVNRGLIEKIVYRSR